MKVVNHGGKSKIKQANSKIIKNESKIIKKKSPSKNNGLDLLSKAFKATRANSKQTKVHS